MTNMIHKDIHDHIAANLINGDRWFGADEDMWKLRAMMDRNGLSDAARRRAVPAFLGGIHRALRGNRSGVDPGG